MKDGGRVLTWANALTSLRLLLCLPVYLLIEQQRWLPCALCLFVAVLTDVFDGKMARKLNQASPMGGFFDHATDALFVTFG
ncbi:MAG: CDP-alcohol phosphatidyltransferase family protein, partial [Pseudomonadota bacterium]|nr:CDP-alcohol phosphatidyltransferase family protein [Pseudomonadota bacterium]